jgi:hypothetical protein
MPTARTVTVDLTRVCGKAVQAWWFDPRTGDALDAGRLPQSASREFTPPADAKRIIFAVQAQPVIDAPAPTGNTP